MNVCIEGRLARIGLKIRPRPKTIILFRKKQSQSLSLSLSLSLFLSLSLSHCPWNTVTLTLCFQFRNAKLPANRITAASTGEFPLAGRPVCSAAGLPMPAPPDLHDRNHPLLEPDSAWQSGWVGGVKGQRGRGCQSWFCYPVCLVFCCCSQQTPSSSVHLFLSCCSVCCSRQKPSSSGIRFWFFGCSRQTSSSSVHLFYGCYSVYCFLVVHIWSHPLPESGSVWQEWLSRWC